MDNGLALRIIEESLVDRHAPDATAIHYVVTNPGSRAAIQQEPYLKVLTEAGGRRYEIELTVRSAMDVTDSV